ncbi:MAG: ABC transporter ATP-binding protein [Bacteroidales bacterium]|nr:ABC transporter ATP-binding protein [Bacteroidales bacterium]
MLRTILRQVGKYRTRALLTPIWTTLEVIVEMLIPYVTAFIIDRGIYGGEVGAIARYGTLMIALASLGLLFGYLAARFAAYSSTGLAANLRGAMYRNIQRFSFSDIDKFSAAGLVTRMTTDVSSVQNAFQMLLRTTFRAPLNLISSLVMCFVINARLSVIFLIAMVILMTFLTILITRAAKLFRQILLKVDAVNSTVRENVDAIRVVKAFASESGEISKFDKAALSLYTLNIRAEGLMALNHPVMNLVLNGAIIALSWYGAHFIVEGSLTTGQLTSLFSYITTTLGSMMMLSMIFVQLTQSIASAERIAAVITEEPDMFDPEDPVSEVPDGRVDFNHVSFAYGESSDNALSDIDIHIAAGETIGIIGGTGSGKSSLVSLIPRLYDATEGSVEVGGIDVRRYSMKALRSKVAMVLQKNTLFSGTILDNLRWGDENATREQCIEACKAASADEFISAFPEGYDTVIAEGGSNVSGGQRQRICIARALLKKPKVLILDDSTSAVDTATDARIRETFRTIFPGVTKIIVSQRILSIKDADRILVLEGGKVSGFDSHQRLLETSDVYREIYNLQTSGGEGDFDEKGGRV